MAQLSSNKCSICTDKLGQLYCYDCVQFLCVICKAIHDKFPSNKEHTVIDVTKEGCRVFKPKPMCEVHKEDYLYYCKGCEYLICSECIISTHAGHKICGYKITVDQQRQKTETLIQTLQAQLKFIEESLEKIKNEKMPKIKSDNYEFSKQVSTTALDFDSIIRHARNIYETTASDYVSTESEKLENIQKLLERFHKNYTDVSLKFENILLEQHGITFLYEQKSIEKEFENLEQIPVIPESIPIANFQRDSFTEVVIKGIQEKFTISMLKEKEEEMQALKIKLDESERSMEQISTLLNKEKKQLQEEFATLEMKTKDEIAQLKDTLLKERNESAQLQADFDSMLKEKEEEMQALKTKLDESERSMEQILTLLNKEKKQLQEEFATLEMKTKDEIAQLNDMLLKERNKSAQLQADVDRKESVFLTRYTFKEREEIQKLKAMLDESESKKHTLTLLNQEKTLLQEEIARLEKENKNVKAKLNEALLKKTTISAQLYENHNSIIQRTHVGFLFTCEKCGIPAASSCIPDQKRNTVSR